MSWMACTTSSATLARRSSRPIPRLTPRPAVPLYPAKPSCCPASLGIPSTLLETDGDIVLCHESAGVPLQGIAGLLAANPARYAEVAGQVVTRTDVAWSFLELSQTNR